MKAMFAVAFLAMIAVAYGGYVAAPVYAGYGGYGVGYAAPVASYGYGIGSYAAPVAYGGYGLSAPYYGGYGLGYSGYGLGLLKK